MKGVPEDPEEPEDSSQADSGIEDSTRPSATRAGLEETHGLDDADELRPPENSVTLTQVEDENTRTRAYVATRKIEVPNKLGHYRIDKPIGAGGFGQVFKAEDTRLERWVAIKFDKRIVWADQGNLKEEAQKLARLRHTGIVAVHDFGEDEKHNLKYLVTDYLEGRTLAQHLRSERFTWQQAVFHCALIADALEHAHQHELTHQDVKPANIILVDGQPVLIDFGLAFLAGHRGISVSALVGTPNYMSPEQTTGDGATVDHRTDIYSLGVVLYRMLTGTRPFASPDDQTTLVLRNIRKGIFQPPRAIVPELPAELEVVCLCAMARNPSDRYPRAADFARALRNLLPAEFLRHPPDSL